MQNLWGNTKQQIVGIVNQTKRNAQHGIKTLSKERKKAGTANTANQNFRTAPTEISTANAASAADQKCLAHIAIKKVILKTDVLKNNGIMASHPTIQTPQHHQMWQM
jgi:hypothetical protein